jgi:hypothetical protein
LGMTHQVGAEKRAWMVFRCDHPSLRDCNGFGPQYPALKRRANIIRSRRDRECGLGTAINSVRAGTNRKCEFKRTAPFASLLLGPFLRNSSACLPQQTCGVPSGRSDVSPALQCRVSPDKIAISPVGTADIAAPDSPIRPEHRLSHARYDTVHRPDNHHPSLRDCNGFCPQYPALKRRANVIRSRWDREWAANIGSYWHPRFVVSLVDPFLIDPPSAAPTSGIPVHSFVPSPSVPGHVSGLQS